MKRAVILLTILAASLTASLVAATTVVKLDFDGLVAASDAIVVGRIDAVDAVVQDGRVYTHVDVRVEETLKGPPQTRLRIVHVGGRTERLATVVHGMPDFAVAERALLFLEQPRGVDHFVVTGLAQGKFSLVEGEDGATKLQPSGAKLRLVPPPRAQSAPASLPAGPLIPATLPATLDEARTRIADLVKRDATE